MDMFDFLFSNSDLRWSSFGSNVKVKSGKDVSTIVLYALGINPADIKVELQEDMLIVTGETDDEVLNKKHYINYKLQVKSDRIEKIVKSCKNGLLNLEVFWKKYENKVEIVEK